MSMLLFMVMYRICSIASEKNTDENIEGVRKGGPYTMGARPPPLAAGLHKVYFSDLGRSEHSDLPGWEH